MVVYWWQEIARTSCVKHFSNTLWRYKKYSGSSGCNSGEPLCGAGATDKERTLGGGFREKAASSY
jgi:hypothetical protein